MKTRVLAMMVLAAVVGTGTTGTARQGRTGDDWCQGERSGDGREQFCEVRDYALPAGASMVAVDAAPNGGIQVTGSQRGDMLVQARVSAYAETMDRAREIAAGVRVDATASQVSAEGPRGLGRHEGWSVSYRLAVPTQSSLTLKSTNGGISVSEVEGRIDISTVNGGVKLVNVNGDVHGRTSNGGIDVDLDGTTWQGEGLNVETSNGGVRLRLPEQYSARIEAGTVNGGINVDFPVTIQGRLDRELNTTIGTGGPLLRVRTHNGGVKVQKK